VDSPYISMARYIPSELNSSDGITRTKYWPTFRQMLRRFQQEGDSVVISNVHPDSWLRDTLVGLHPQIRLPARGLVRAEDLWEFQLSQ